MKILAIALLMLLFTTQAQSKEITHDKFVLSNGLRVIVHEDRKAPIVSVGVWYHVGSKDEPKGKTGFAHLFEHIMYKGSENFSGSFINVMSEMGGTNINGTTSFDRTNYYATVPTQALERLLWLESDRMGYLLGAVTQKVLDDERKVVQNEKRQSEGQPYGLMNVRVGEALYPSTHPYHHTPIGYMDDLNNASVDDVHQWFKQYYGAANAVVVLSGDIDVETAKELMEKYFGDIASGPPLHKSTVNIPARLHNTTDVMYDRVTQSLITRSWAIPSRTHRDKIMLDVAVSVLGGNSGRLYKALVEDRKLATEVNVALDPRELSSLFTIIVKLKNGMGMPDLEQAIDEVVEEFIINGPTEEELEKNRNYLDTVILSELNDVQAKGLVLAQGELYAGDPSFINKDLKWTREATSEDVQYAAEKWLSNGYHQLTILPFGEPKAVPSKVDRAIMPEVKDSLSVKLPEIHERVLPNGLKVVVVEQPDEKIVRVGMVFNNSGTIGDSLSAPMASMALLANMNKLTDGLTSEELEKLKSKLGVNLSLRANSFDAVVSMEAFSERLPQSLELMAQMTLNPAFSEDELNKWQDQVLESIKNSLSQPNAIAVRAMSTMLYGSKHPLSEYPDIQGKIASLDMGSLKEHYETWIRPDNAVVYVVGGTTLQETLDLVEREYGSWQAPKQPLSKVDVDYTVPKYNKSKVILVDNPMSPQSLILGGRVFASSSFAAELAADVANEAFGGGMAGRINTNLRVEKGWTYGAGSGLSKIPNQTIWQFQAPVQSNKTALSINEVIKEMGALNDNKPISQDELNGFRKSMLSSLPAQFKNSQVILGSLMNNAFFGRPLDDAERIAGYMEAIKLKDVKKAANSFLQPEPIIWVIVTDLEKNEQAIRDLNIGVVEIWSADGKVN